LLRGSTSCVKAKGRICVCVQVPPKPPRLPQKPLFLSYLVCLRPLRRWYSRYWHFSYSCRSCSHLKGMYAESRLHLSKGKHRKEVSTEVCRNARRATEMAVLVQRDEHVCAVVPHVQRKPRLSHLLAGHFHFCAPPHNKSNHASLTAHSSASQRTKQHHCKHTVPGSMFDCLVSGDWPPRTTTPAAFAVLAFADGKSIHRMTCLTLHS